MTTYNPVLNSIKLSVDYHFLKLKYFCEVKDGTHDTPEYVDAGENTYPLVTSKDINDGIMSFKTAKHISEEDYLAINRRSNVEKYDVIMPMIGTIGNPAIIDTDEKFSIKNVALFKINGDLTKAKYLKYLLSSEIVQKQISLLNRGGVQSFLSLGVLENISITTSNALNINKIVAYLDLKTSVIDELISSKLRLIQLLEEKRQSIITEAVIKGLNPNVKMKSSGIEWIGEIPAHWEVKKIKRIVLEHKQGFYTTEDYNDDGVKLIRITDINKKSQVDVTNSPRVNISDREKKIFRVYKGDFLFARTGGAGSFGLIENSSEEAVFASYLIRFRFIDEVCTNFLKYYFISNAFKNGINSSVHGGVNQNVHAEDIKNQTIVIPPFTEQNSIADSLDNKVNNIDNLVELVATQIQKLKEYRQSLIYEAVTGKIDIRNFEVVS